jgi:hypothetical protein
MVPAGAEVDRYRIAMAVMHRQQRIGSCVYETKGKIKSTLTVTKRQSSYGAQSSSLSVYVSFFLTSGYRQIGSAPVRGKLLLVRLLVTLRATTKTLSQKPPGSHCQSACLRHDRQSA